MNEEQFRTGVGVTGPLHGIHEAYADVFRFHKTFGHPYSASPVMQPQPRVFARSEWIIEEVVELGEARTIYDQADAYLDIMYFAVGGLVEMGIDPAHIWPLVQKANMAKQFPDGSVKRREDGKILKPDGWVAPDEAIGETINRLIEDARAPLLEPHTGDMADMVERTRTDPPLPASVGSIDGTK